ncbi:hypothetical protein E3E35_07200 [Thermococcus sp. GR7]|uniref:hypothetical protein n=1 Tax=unclassified Thermococcus TaxID=2627626 RepID=UPI0014300DF3|nr:MULTISPECIES: hypothetical protein [unclassified Thermococcus]NJE47190.1 hypothetical protein [Thermococcus sp. GR7]NJE77985.1 hypothetical protein [Thermococcus sp. GR4]NJF22898.1 hypothetical protein [Thermococcus sp. GR5]
MKPTVSGFLLTILALIVIGGAVYYLIGEYGSQRFIEGQRDYERLCIRQMTSLTLSDVRFHSQEAFNSLERNSTETFNLSMIELASDLSRLESNLVSPAMYIFPEDFPDNETLVNMTKNDRCITFIELSRNAFLNGTANISAVREGLNLIYNFATEWRENGNYPSEELLKANAELQQKCSALVPKVVNP